MLYRSAALLALCACGFSAGVNNGAIDAAVDPEAIVDAVPDGPPPACPQNTVGTCPANYIKVANNCDFTAGEFCIAKYEMKDVGGVATSTPLGIPWGNINTTQAKARCAALGGRYHLVTNEEWMATARAIEATPENWSTTATPFMSKGNTDACGACPATPTCPGPAGADNAPCVGTAGPNCANRGSAEWRFNRTARIGTSGILWDLSGNMFELIDFPQTLNATRGVHPGESINAITGASFNPPWPEAKFKSANLAHTDDPGMVGQAAVQNIGLLYVTDPAASPNVTRGGDYCGFAGIYAIALLRDSELGVNIGFRCAFR